MKGNRNNQKIDPMELETYLEQPEAYSDSLDPSVERLVDSLDHLQYDAERQPRPAFIEELARELQARRKGKPTRKKTRRPLRGRVRALAGAAVVAALVALLAYAGSLLNAPEPEPAASEWAFSGQTYTFYLFDTFAATRLVPLDPETLKDRSDGEALEPGGLFSADGSTRVDTKYPEGLNVNSPGLDPQDIWIVVRDLPSGTERARFHPPVQGLVSAVSADGSRLVLKPYPHSRYPPIAEWYVVDTADGQLLAHVRDEENACFRQHALVGPAVRRIYCVVDPMITGAREPEPMRIAAYDVESATKTGERELPGVLIGQREIDLDGQTATEHFEPAMALSPDGRRLAIVHADADKITLVDAHDLTVERTFSLDRSSTLWDLFTPAVIYAKGEMIGTIRRAEFALDGRHLYVFSQEVNLVPGQDPPEQPDLWLVDLEQGTLAAQALTGNHIQWVQPAPDGTVYAFGTTDEDLGPYEIRPSSPSTLWRLDALTLEILAEREFAGYRGGRVILR